MILQTVTPVEPLVQKVIHRFYLPKGLSLFAKFAIWGESVMVCFFYKYTINKYNKIIILIKLQIYKIVFFF